MLTDDIQHKNRATAYIPRKISSNESSFDWKLNVMYKLSVALQLHDLQATLPFQLIWESDMSVSCFRLEPSIQRNVHIPLRLKRAQPLSCNHWSLEWPLWISTNYHSSPRQRLWSPQRSITQNVFGSDIYWSSRWTAWAHADLCMGSLHSNTKMESSSVHSGRHWTPLSHWHL